MKLVTRTAIERLSAACSEINQRTWRRLRRCRTWDYDRRDASEGAHCRYSVGEHGGAEGLALSPEYTAARKMDKSYARYNVVAVDGVQQSDVIPGAVLGRSHTDTTPKRKGRPKPDAWFDNVIRIRVEDELGGRVPVLQSRSKRAGAARRHCDNFTGRRTWRIR